MSDSPDVSIIIRTFNRPERLRECLTAVAKQSYDSLQAVIVNDAGEDVEHIVKETLSNRLHKSIRNATNMGRTAALNIGIDNADGRYICFLDDDDIIYPEHLQTLADAALSSNRPMVYSDVINVTYQKDTLSKEWRRVQEQLVYSFNFDRDNFLLANYIPITCWLVRRDCFDAVGPFDESLLVYEDWEFLIRLSRKFDFYHIPKVTGEYRRRDDNSNMLEKDLYTINEQVVKRRYRDDRDQLFDKLFKMKFQHQRDMNQQQQRFDNLVRQAGHLQNQLAEAQRMIARLQQQNRQPRPNQETGNE